ncbi:MAG: glycosyltransferase family 2 protein [Brevundimonas sp.]|nr:MAG: glycosyltransferase family 2 protein [Brevundimonas sp.]
MTDQPARKPRLSVIVVTYNMAREAPRTLWSLSPEHQIGVSAEDYEIIVVDNGSRPPLTLAEGVAGSADLRLHRVENATVSPVPGINQALDMARGDLVGVFIDGARMASPGLLATALMAARLHDQPLIGAIAFHLGPDVQSRSIAEGYDQAVEDRLLDDCRWRENGYSLFGVSVLASSSKDGWFAVPTEANAVFMRADLCRRLGGFDPAFVAPGGGLANLDLWARALSQPDAQLILLLGEATFHQVHGGVATNSLISRYPEFHEEYRRIRGRDFALPDVSPLFLGRLPTEAASSIARSAKAWIKAQRPPDQ